MGKECGAWVSRRLWGGGNTSPLKTTAWEAIPRVELSIPLCSRIFDDKMTSKATSTQSSKSWPDVFCLSNGGR